MPQEWFTGAHFTGDVQSCGNCRGINQITHNDVVEKVVDAQLRSEVSKWVTKWLHANKENHRSSIWLVDAFGEENVQEMYATWKIVVRCSGGGCIKD